METATFICNLPSSSFLFISENVPSLVYYTHIPTIIVSVFLAVYVLLGDRKSIYNRVFAFTLGVFALWLVCNLLFWASNRGDVIMFAWSSAILYEPLIYVGALYLVHLLLTGKDVSFKTKLVWFLLYAPLFVLNSTNYILQGFDVTNCIAIESQIAYWSYGIEVVFMLCLIDVFRKHYRTIEGEITPFTLFVVGLTIFLSIFTLGNIIGSSTNNWNIAQVGIAGAYIFFGVCLYVFVQYNFFKIKILATEAIVASFSFLVFSLIFLRHLETFQRIFIFITFLFCLLMGYMFIRISRREVKLIRELETTHSQLKDLNAFQAEFASNVTHQVLTPLTGIKGYVSIISEDEAFFEKNKRHVLDAINRLTERLTVLLRDFTDVYSLKAKNDNSLVRLSEVCEVDSNVVVDRRIAKAIKSICECCKRNTADVQIRVEGKTVMIKSTSKISIMHNDLTIYQARRLILEAGGKLHVYENEDSVEFRVEFL